MIGVEKRQWRLKSRDDDSGLLLAGQVRARRPPDRGSRHALEHHQPRPRRAPDAVQQRERNSEPDALLDREHDDRRRRHGDQKKFAERLPVDRDDLIDANDAQGDEQQHAAERRVRNSAEQRSAEDQQRDHDRRRGEAGELGAAAGLGNHRGARRAGVDRKRADQSRQDAADTDADEVAVDIRRLVGAGRKGSRGRRRLHHHHDRDDETERHQARQPAGRDVRHRQRRQRGGDRAENADAAALEPEQRHAPRSPAQGRSRRRECAHRSAPTGR